MNLHLVFRFMAIALRLLLFVAGHAVKAKLPDEYSAEALRLAKECDEAAKGFEWS